MAGELFGFYADASAGARPAPARQDASQDGEVLGPAEALAYWSERLDGLPPDRCRSPHRTALAPADRPGSPHGPACASGSPNAD
ncbi:hypothetical protein J2Z21_004278 [Streptomyces griseochromogenes]|uniref:Uncharacterized protein n=1 Tax=Streptomyces griseochromogenes TaxID=68214 RepID=A0A1B1AVK0_9ACTN|nr:hypothetical protein [Streptomyces griseochromogenes]ANP50542.1 hypothetical protein AVL59_13740 [Streptomyces griseochromogenes]MBP2051307.1 hypothetical protein [Streptomyces griseochromogenes]